MRRKPRVTLLDVAAAAGVSRTTASYVINGRSSEMRISDEAQTRVMAVVRELGYRPNRSATSLRTSRSATIGIVSDFVAGGQFSGRMISGANAAARSLEHLVVIGESEGDPELERMLVEEMVDRDVDGVLYATRTTRRVALPPALVGVPCVLMNCVDAYGRAPAVVPDDRGGGRLAAQALVNAGIDEGIWIVGEDPTPGATAGRLRVEGAAAVLARRGHSLAGVIRCDWTVGEARAAVSNWLAGGGSAQGMICLNDRVAMGTYQALDSAGLRAPEDVSIVSFDGSDLAGWLHPPVSSVALPFYELGQIATRLLLAQDIEQGVRLVPMSLLDGGSIRQGEPLPATGRVSSVGGGAGPPPLE